MPILYNPYKKKGVFMIPAGGLGPSVSADFSYSKSSYHQDEADPTPTITGTPGGAFICTSGAVFVDTGSTSSSTGQIDLDASTIDTHLISYTVDGVTATANVGITASPFIANNFSMEFDGINDYIDLGNNPPIFTDFSLSFWYKQSGGAGSFEAVVGRDTIDGGILTSIVFTGGILHFKNRPGSWTALTTTAASNTEFKHYSVTYDSSENELKGYCNGNLEVTTTPVFSSATGNEHSFNRIGRYGSIYHLDGFLDELAAWNTALSSDAVTEIYDATNNNTGKALDLNTDTGNYTSSSNLQYWNRMGD